MSMTRASLIPALGIGVVCLFVSGIVAGGEGILGAVIGVVVVALFFVSSSMALGPGSRHGAGRAAAYFLLFILGNCLALIIVIVVLLNAGGIADRVDTTALGLTILTSSLAWTVAMLRAAGKSRQPLYDLSSED